MITSLLWQVAQHLSVLGELILREELPSQVQLSSSACEGGVFSNRVLTPGRKPRTAKEPIFGESFPLSPPIAQRGLATPGTGHFVRESMALVGSITDGAETQSDRGLTNRFA